MDYSANGPKGYHRVLSLGYTCNLIIVGLAPARGHLRSTALFDALEAPGEGSSNKRGEYLPLKVQVRGLTVTS